MKLDDLRKAAAKADHELQRAESRAKELKAKARAAKAALQKARLDHKLSRKTAKQARNLAQAADDQVRDQLRVWEKAQKRLGKALKKLAQVKASKVRKPAQAAAARLPRRTARLSSPKPSLP
jgi:chromosome segregation ATPase